MAAYDQFNRHTGTYRALSVESGGRRARAVLGLSGSPESWHALAFGSGWAQRTGNALDVVHVARSTYVDVTEGFAAAAVSECAHEQAQALAGETAAWMRGRDIEWSFHLLLGSPALALERFARARAAGTVILGRPRPRLLRSGVVARLSRHTDRIVIAVP